MIWNWIKRQFYESEIDYHRQFLKGWGYPEQGAGKFGSYSPDCHTSQIILEHARNKLAKMDQDERLNRLMRVSNI